MTEPERDFSYFEKTVDAFKGLSTVSEPDTKIFVKKFKRKACNVYYSTLRGKCAISRNKQQKYVICLSLEML